MTDIASKLSFYAALLLSSVLTIMLLSAAANFGFGPLLSSGLPAVLIVAVMLFNPLIFGVLGFSKGSAKWRFIAAGAMLTLLLLYMLAAFGLFGPISG